MDEGFRVPKRQILVTITLAGQAPAEVSLYLAERAERHSDVEYPSDLLNGGDDFIPATDSEGRVLVFRRSAVMLLSVAGEHEAEHVPGSANGDDEVTTVAVELKLEDGTHLKGDLAYWRPEGQRREQDFLNTSEDFVPLWEGEVVHLVNRRRIVSLLRQGQP